MVSEKVVAPVLLTLREHEFIQNGVFGLYFPWFVNYKEVNIVSDIDPRIVNKISNPSFFGHKLMERSTTPGIQGVENSKHYPIFEDIFLRWCKDNNYPVRTILRAALNITTYNDAEFSVPHHDHDFPCNNWIMYLNSVDAPTLLFDDDYNIIDSILAEKYQAVAFPSILHAHKFAPINQLRYVVVFTFES